MAGTQTGRTQGQPGALTQGMVVTRNTCASLVVTRNTCASLCLLWAQVQGSKWRLHGLLSAGLRVSRLTPLSRRGSQASLSALWRSPFNHRLKMQNRGIRGESCILKFCSIYIQFNSLTFCDPMDCSMPGFPVHHQLPELTQTHVHRVTEAILPSHPLSSPPPSAFSLSQHQGLFK